MKANYNRRMTNRPTRGLTQTQVIDYYVKGHTPADWIKTIQLILKRIAIGGKWMWENAHMIIHRDGDDSYSIERM